MPQLTRLLPLLWSLVLAVLLLGSALGPGYVLTYDMVWVPDLALRSDAVGTGTALPRAVPSDAVVAIVDEVVPSVLLQKLVLLGSLVGLGTGAALLVGGPTTGRLVAVSLAQWNPFVVERLVIGHWPVLMGCAVLPWLFVAGRRMRRAGRVPPEVPWLLLAGSLSASAGLVTAVGALLTLLRRGRQRTNLLVLSLVVAANLPWAAAGLLHADAARADPVGATLFATQGHGLLPGPLAALTLGGIWNAEVVPDSRFGVGAVLFLLALVLLAAMGVSRTSTAVEGWCVRALVVAWVLGMTIALLSWGMPAAMGWMGAHVPGAALLRDGSRSLVLALPLTVVLVANGATTLRERMPESVSRVVASAVLVVLPVTVMPDAAFGASGALTAVQVPSSYDEVRAVVARAPEGDAVSLPFTSYRAPHWNGDRKVLDPVPRLLDRDTVVDDRLSVSGRVVEGEDPRAREIRQALAASSAEERSSALTAAGVSVAVVSNVRGQRPPPLAGTTVLDTTEVEVVVLDGDVRPHSPKRTWQAVMSLAWGSWLWLLVVWAVSVRRGTVRRREDMTRRM